MAADRPDPHLAQDGKVKLFLCQQVKGYSNLDPSKTPQQALPISILLHLHSAAITNINKVAAELLIGFLPISQCVLANTVQSKEEGKQNC
jgi:hypothetical protein